MLAEIYCTQQVYPYCPLWSLAWDYRKNNLMREITSHNGDIICLQEVQHDHYDNFFYPHMKSIGCVWIVWYEGCLAMQTLEFIRTIFTDMKEFSRERREKPWDKTSMRLMDVQSFSKRWIFHLHWIGLIWSFGLIWSHQSQWRSQLLQDRFAMTEKHEIEFDEISRHYQSDNRRALRRLLKVCCVNDV